MMMPFCVWLVMMDKKMIRAFGGRSYPAYTTMFNLGKDAMILFVL